MSGGLLAVIEAAYDVESTTEETWLRAIVEAARPRLDAGLGVVGYTWSAGADGFKIRAIATASCAIPTSSWKSAVMSATPEYVAHAWLAKSVGTASGIPGWKHPAHREGQMRLAEYGCIDILNVNALNPEGMGCVLAAPLPTTIRVGKSDEARWTRVAAHLAAAHRLRARLAEASSPPRSERAEAVLTANGKLEHATGEAAGRTARDALREAASVLAKMKRGRAVDEDEHLERRQALVNARWSLLDSFERNGQRFVLAMVNEPVRQGPEALSSRERQVLALAAMERSNKLIAYELGLSDSTVRVLLTRACRKLGVRSRAAAIDCWRSFAAGARDV